MWDTIRGKSVRLSLIKTPRNEFRRSIKENERFQNNRNTTPKQYQSSRTRNDWKTVGESAYYQID
ncbi:hypothetical protein F383_15199 [Gossypium arboreum]|uniref:Uncharacterized protein n=1 Tax=Gossypium arboreum TaxID=29729 RepID=A0A0B0PTI9_GOSAR|nr:hypothetical protein F383_15199 [Gossypium arboreum]